ncbi:MAG: hypothetical protein GY909_09115 [Oligoflexia bacterium]|nr:hypothetical protein [Oligoflexia bacterium]
MQTISVYFNQRASQGGAQFWKDKIGQSLFRSELLFRSPENLDELEETLKSDLDQNVDAIVSVGGDGTVNTLIQEIAGKDVGLLVVPGGTANDLACELGNQKNINKVISRIRSKELKKIDLIKVNNRYMATNGGIGFAGDVASKVNKLRKKFPLFKKVMGFAGRKIYPLFAMQELLGLDLEYYDLNLESPDFSGQVTAAAVLVNNQSMIGGTFNVAPDTRNDDGKFNVCIVTHPTRHELLTCLYKLSIGEFPENDPHFISFETDSLTIKNLNPSKKVNFFGDGEVFDSENDSEACSEWNISIENQALNVFTKCSEKDLVDLVNEVTLE